MRVLLGRRVCACGCPVSLRSLLLLQMQGERNQALDRVNLLDMELTAVRGNTAGLQMALQKEQQHGADMEAAVAAKDKVGGGLPGLPSSVQGPFVWGAVRCLYMVAVPTGAASACSLWSSRWTHSICACCWFLHVRPACCCLAACCCRRFPRRTLPTWRASTMSCAASWRRPWSS